MQIPQYSIDVKSGVKQGDPCSSLLFILAIEALATKIPQNKAMDGNKINLFAELPKK